MTQYVVSFCKLWVTEGSKHLSPARPEFNTTLNHKCARFREILFGWIGTQWQCIILSLSFVFNTGVAVTVWIVECLYIWQIEVLVPSSQSIIYEGRGVQVLSALLQPHPQLSYHGVAVTIVWIVECFSNNQHHSAIVGLVSCINCAPPTQPVLFV